MATMRELIHRHYPDMARQERQVADFVLDHMDDLATYSSIELATLCDVSKATVSRLFKRLGYASYRDVKEAARLLRQSGQPVASTEQARQGRELTRHLERESENLARATEALQSVDLDALLHALAASRRLVMIGFRNSYPVAQHARQKLLQVRDHVSLLPVPGQTLGEDLAGLTRDDLVVLVGFRRRPAGFDRLLGWLQNQGVPVCLLAEPTAVTLGQRATWWLPVPLDSISAFDSYAGAMSVVNYLANSLLEQHLATGRQRIRSVMDIYDDLDELSLEMNL